MKHMKEWKIKLYAADSRQTSDGSWRTGYVCKGSFWANVKPVSATANYTNVGIFELAELIATINKPRSFEVTTGMYAIWGDRVLRSTRIEDVDGKTRGDVRIYFKSDTGIRPDIFLDKVITD